VIEPLIGQGAAAVPLLNFNDSLRVRTRQIPRLSPNGRNRRHLSVHPGFGEGRLSTHRCISRNSDFTPKIEGF